MDRFPVGGQTIHNAISDARDFPIIVLPASRNVFMEALGLPSPPKWEADTLTVAPDIEGHARKVIDFWNSSITLRVASPLKQGTYYLSREGDASAG